MEGDARRRNSVLGQGYAWLTVGFAATGGVATFTAHSTLMQAFVFGNIAVYWGLLIAELVRVFALAAMRSRLPTEVATAPFLFSTALSGLTRSGIFPSYTDVASFIAVGILPP